MGTRAVPGDGQPVWVGGIGTVPPVGGLPPDKVGVTPGVRLPGPLVGVPPAVGGLPEPQPASRKMRQQPSRENTMRGSWRCRIYFPLQKLFYNRTKEMKSTYELM